ncbi:hypothetical protein OIU78_024884 [Salix suchowensis]|nr:hypothetical protein OIU78_024884 [Salix suchowensis]
MRLEDEIVWGENLIAKSQKDLDEDSNHMRTWLGVLPWRGGMHLMMDYLSHRFDIRVSGFDQVAKIINEDDLAYVVFVERSVGAENFGNIDDGLCNSRNSAA